MVVWQGLTIFFVFPLQRIFYKCSAHSWHCDQQGSATGKRRIISLVKESKYQSAIQLLHVEHNARHNFVANRHAEIQGSIFSAEYQQTPANTRTHIRWALQGPEYKQEQTYTNSITVRWLWWHRHFHLVRLGLESGHGSHTNKILANNNLVWLAKTAMVMVLTMMIMMLLMTMTAARWTPAKVCKEGHNN